MKQLGAMIMAASDEPTAEDIARKKAHHRATYEREAPFMIDNWPASVLAVSFPTIMVPIEQADIALIFNPEHEEWRARAGTLAARLDDVMDWRRYFIRMNSRSPKDTGESLVTCSGRQAVDMITCSERCLDDAIMMMHAEAPVFVCLREFRPMHADGEFRCFAKDGEVLGVSRYFHQTEPEHRPEAGTVLAAAKRFYDTHLREHYPTVAFDLYAPGTDQEVLIEINPYWTADPCLFESHAEISGERLG